MVNYDAQDGFSVSSSLPTPNAYGLSPAELVNNGDSSNPSNSTNSLATDSTPQNNHPHPQQQQQQSVTGGAHLNPIRTGAAAMVVPSTSVLIIQEVHFKHAGNYTCAPSNARPTSITVHVLKSKSRTFALYLFPQSYPQYIYIYIYLYIYIALSTSLHIL